MRPYIQHHISLCTITTIIPQNTQHILVSYRTSTHSTKPERARSCPFCRSPYKLLGGGDTAGAAESDAGVGCLPYEYSVKLINKVGAEMSLSPRRAGEMGHGIHVGSPMLYLLCGSFRKTHLN